MPFIRGTRYMMLARGAARNAAPVIVVPGAQSAVSNVALAITGTSLSDADGNTQTVTLTVSHGTLTLASTTGLTFTAGDGTSDATMTFSGTVANVNTAIATITYTSPDYAGADTLAISTDDGAGGTDSDSIAITVTFTPASISSLVAWYNWNTGAWEDGGTNAAENTDPLYRLTPAGQPTLYAEQATLNSRPIYNIGGTNGKCSSTFDGSNGFMTVADDAAFSLGTGDFFVIALATAANASVGRYFWSKQKAAANYNGVGVGVNGGRKPYFECFDGSGTTALTGATTLTSGQYYRIGAGRTGSTINILLNNTNDATGAAYTGSVTQAVAAAIGCFSGGGHAWKGDMAQLCIFNAYPSSTHLGLLDTYLAAQVPA